MAESTSHVLQLLLGEIDQDAPVSVPLESFLMFDNSMSHSLDALERRWSDFATPNSLRRDIWAHFER